MAATEFMEEPVCLIKSDSEGKLCMVPSALAILEQIHQHVVVVGVVGLYRSGKSYLMNRLAGAQKGFALGSTIQSETKGIWMWCVHHPRKRDHTLVLLDTEGLGDVEKGDEKNDNWIFALAVLLSSTLVYNSMGTIDNNALEKLHYVTELTEHIKVKSNKSSEAEESEYMRFFPSFVWTVRDFTLELQLDGNPITSDQYLENALKLKPGHSQKIQEYNQPRSCLRNYFSPRSCFVFERPANALKMRQMENLTDADLEPAFVKQANEFSEHIFNNSNIKTLKGGMRVTGRLLGNLAQTYVDAIRSGQIPCLDNAVVALSEIENSNAIERAKALYLESMASWVAYPTVSHDELSEIHAHLEEDALKLFMKHAFKDEGHKYQMKLMELLQREYNQICETDRKESLKASQLTIKRVFEPMENNLNSGFYIAPGGYSKYCSDLEQLTREYQYEDGTGVMAKEALRDYLDGKISVGHAISAGDESLSEAEQKAAEEQIREKCERDNQSMAEGLRAQERVIEEQSKTYKLHVSQLKEKMEMDKQNALAEHQRVLKAKDKEMEDLRRQGFEERAQLLQQQIDALKEERKVEEQKEESFMGKALNVVGDAAMMFLPGIVPKLGGLAAKLFSKWL